MMELFHFIMKSKIKSNALLIIAEIFFLHSFINILPLKPEKKIENDNDRWLYFFKEGQNLDIDKLPDE